MQLYVPADLPTAMEAVALARPLADSGLGFRVGPRLLSRHGVGAVTMLREFGPVLADARLAGDLGALTASARTLAAGGATEVTLGAGAGVGTITAIIDSVAPHGARLLVVPTAPAGAGDASTTGHAGRGRMVSRLAAAFADLPVGLLGSMSDIGVVAQVAPGVAVVVDGLAGGDAVTEARERGADGAVLVPGVVGSDTDVSALLVQAAG